MANNIYPYSVETLKLALQLSPESISFDALKNMFGFKKTDEEEFLTTIEGLKKEGFLKEISHRRYAALQPFSHVLVAKVLTSNRRPRISRKKAPLAIVKGGREIPIPFPISVKNSMLTERDLRPGDRIAATFERHMGAGLRATKIHGAFKAGKKPLLTVTFNAESKKASHTSRDMKTIFRAAGKIPGKEKSHRQKDFQARIPDYFDPLNPEVILLDSRHDHDSGKLISHIIAAKHGILTEHSRISSREARQRSSDKSFLRDKHRYLLADEPILVIDPDDAHDHDDGVMVQRIPGGFRSLVAIADVAYYVRAGTPLDKEAYDRGFSHYLHEDHFPMLPPKLVDQASLTSGKLVPVIYCEQFWDQEGNLVSTKIDKGTIQNQKNISYSLFESWIACRGQFGHPASRDQQDLMDWVARNNIDVMDYVDFGEMRIDEHREEKGLVLDEGAEREANPFARCFVERMMINTNIAFAEELSDYNIPFPKRVHGVNTNELAYWEGAKALRARGYDIPLNPLHCTNACIKTLLKTAEQRFERRRVEGHIMSHLMGEGRYSVLPIDHFCLDEENYTHGTSPIRRYADLLVQRALHLSLGSREMALTDAEIDSLPRKTTHLNRMQQVQRNIMLDANRYYGTKDILTSLNKGNRTIRMDINKITEHGVEIGWRGKSASRPFRKWIYATNLPEGLKLGADHASLICGKMTLTRGGQLHVTIGDITPDRSDWTPSRIVARPKQSRRQKALWGGEEMRHRALLGPVLG